MKIVKWILVCVMLNLQLYGSPGDEVHPGWSNPSVIKNTVWSEHVLPRMQLRDAICFNRAMRQFCLELAEAWANKNYDLIATRMREKIEQYMIFTTYYPDCRPVLDFFSDEYRAVIGLKKNPKSMIPHDDFVDLALVYFHKQRQYAFEAHAHQIGAHLAPLEGGYYGQVAQITTPKSLTMSDICIDEVGSPPGNLQKADLAK